jgi:hypothetical protein
MYQRNEVKISWLFIAIGLILGGIIGIMQQPPPEPSAGWTFTQKEVYNTKSIIIPDQNNDNVNDIFVWNNPEIGNQNSSNNIARILDGRTGEIIRETIYTDSKSLLFLDTNGKNNIFHTESGHIILLGILYRPTGSNKIEDSINPRAGPLLIQIKVSTLEMTKVVNITKEGWESIAPFQDYVNFTDANFINFYWINHLCVFLKNMSISPPGSSYKGELLVINNLFPFLNDALDGYNHSKRVYTFVRPDTLEKVSEIYANENILGKSNNFIEDFVEGPQNELEYSKKLPYLFIIHEDPNLPNAKNKSLSIISINNLQNHSQSNTFIVENLSVFEHDFQLNNNFYYEIMVYMNYNSSNQLAGLSVLLKFPKLVNNTIPENFRTQIKTPWFKEEQILLTLASFMESYNLDRIAQGDFNKSFAFYSKFPNTLPHLGDFSLNNIGVIQKVIPIKYNISQPETSLALICFNSFPEYVTFNEIPYAKMNMKIIYLDPNKIGTDPAIFNQTLTSEERFQREIPCNGELENANIFNPTNFDFDNDSKTDILLPGTVIGDNLLEFKNQISGPFTLVSPTTLIKTTYLYVEYGRDFIARSDVNGDKKGDVFFSNQYLFFILEEEEAPSWWEMKVSDPLNMTFMIIGVVMMILGILIIITTLIKFRKISSKNLIFSKGMIFQLVLATILIGVLYLQLLDLLNVTSQQSGLLVGITAESTAVSNLTRISGYATFAFFTALPVSIGVYILLAPKSADMIVGFNQVFYGKQQGLKAVIKKEAISDEELQKSSHIDYRLMIVPPFGRPNHIFLTISRVLSVLALTVSIGLNFFTYGSGLMVDISQISLFTGFGDKNFVLYISAIFLYLIIPGIIAVPLFFWLIPSTWLLDDVGVLFYAKRTNNRTPEDVESVAGWFSNYLKGFLGLGAIFSYIQFVLKSPITASLPNLAPYGNTVSIFVFGYVIIAGLAFGIITVVFHEIALPYTATALTKRLEARKVPIERTKIEFVKSEPLKEQDFLEGYKKSNPERKKPKIE